MIQKERYLLNIACIDVSGQNFGTILSLYAFGSVDDMQESIPIVHIRTEIGYVFVKFAL